jgi:8-oxo-dGTP diphosphatase
MSDARLSSHEAGYHRFRLIGDVHLLLHNPEGQLLFGRRKNTGFADGSYHLPAGHLDAGESVTEALIREAKEEIGIGIAAGDVEFAHVMHNAAGDGRIAFFFAVRTWQGEPENREPDKCSELRWFPVSRLPEPIVDYCQAALDAITAGRQFSLYGW